MAKVPRESRYDDATLTEIRVEIGWVAAGDNDIEFNKMPPLARRLILFQDRESEGEYNTGLATIKSY